MKETDLYPPLKRFLESQGYEVKGEVQDCDVVAVRGGEAPLLVELKLNLTVDLILQGVDRVAISDAVYVGVPRTCPYLKRRRSQVLKLARMLGLGLLTIDPAARVGAVDVLCDPVPYQPRKTRKRTVRLLKEFTERVGDPNAGGAARRRGLMTAYRQKAIGIGCYLRDHGPTKASRVAQKLAEPRARDLLYRNVYGWFERTDLKGVYGLSPRGETEIPDWTKDG